jgi:hypothetical protein
MTKVAVLFALVVTAVASPAQAQQVRAFVSGGGLDTNTCSLAQPCRTFQHAHDIVPANALIEALDPAGYQPVTITKGISIQGHGYGSIFQTTSGFPNAAITVAVTTSDPVTLNGLLLDGVGTGGYGILITSGPSVQVLNSVVRHFQYGIYDQTSTNGSKLLIEDTIASDNLSIGIVIQPNSGGSIKATLSRITANNNGTGVHSSLNHNTTIANSVLSNNNTVGLNNGGGVNWLAKTVISGNTTGVSVLGTVNSYGDNYIRDNTTPVNGSLTPVMTQ